MTPTIAEYTAELFTLAEPKLFMQHFNTDPVLRIRQEELRVELNALADINPCWSILREEKRSALQAQCAMLGHVPAVIRDGANKCYYCGATIE